MANSVLDSFTPRRLARVSRMTSPTAISTLQSLITGNAEEMAATPAATDTETVSV